MIHNLHAAIELSCLVAIDDWLPDSDDLGPTINVWLLILVVKLMMIVRWLSRIKSPFGLPGAAVELVEESEALLGNFNKLLCLMSLSLTGHCE